MRVRESPPIKDLLANVVAVVSFLKDAKVEEIKNVILTVQDTILR